MVRARLSRSGAASNKDDAPVLLSERQRAVLVLEENSTRRPELAHEVRVVGLHVDVRVGNIAVDVEKVEVDFGERAGVLAQEEPCGEDARDYGGSSGESVVRMRRKLSIGSPISSTLPAGIVPCWTAEVRLGPK